MNDDEILEVVRAHKEGKRIEVLPYNEKTWHDLHLHTLADIHGNILNQDSHLDM